MTDESESLDESDVRESFIFGDLLLLGDILLLLLMSAFKLIRLSICTLFFAVVSSSSSSSIRGKVNT